MKYTLINCYSDNNKGDSGIILSTIELLKEFDDAANIVGVSTYNNSDPCFSKEHLFLKNYIDVLPSIFGELNIGIYKGFLAKNARLIYDTFRLIIILIIPAKFNSLIEYIFSKSELKTLKRIKESDYIISKGGSFICNEKGLRDKLGLIRFLFIFSVCFKFNKKVVILSQSIGPIYGNFSKRYVNYILSKCYWIVFREDLCLTKYPYIEYTNDRSTVLNDIAFHLRTANLNSTIDFKLEDFSVGFTIKEVDKELRLDYENMMIDGIKHCIDKFGAKIFLFPHVTIDNDVEVSFDIYRKLPDYYKTFVTVFNDDYNAKELKKMYSNMSLFVGTRLHSTIFAIGEHVPSICISYHGTKSEGIFSNYGLEKYAINNYVSIDLIKAIDDIIDNKERVKKILLDRNKLFRNNFLEIFKVIFAK